MKDALHFLPVELIFNESLLKNITYSFKELFKNI